MKLLYILNAANRVNNFSHASMLAALDLGIEFHIAGNWGYASDAERKQDEEKYGIRIHQVDIERSPYSLKNIAAYKHIVSIIQDEQIDCIHCNTPVGGLLGRLAGKKCKVKKVIYQAHGFHFYKGAPLTNWLIYYPIERWLARMTDALVTINKEDFEQAKYFRLRKNGQAYYVPGVGIEPARYIADPSVRESKRAELGLAMDAVMLISMGDLIDRKNYPTAIQAVAKADDANLQYFICGKGSAEKDLQDLAEKLGVGKQVHFLGYRADVRELLHAADIFLFTTKQEGLARSLMEAMASGLPCVVSNIRGNVDLIEGGEGGFLCETEDVNAYASALQKLAVEPALREKMQKRNLKVIRRYDISVVTQDMRRIYQEVFQ